MRTHIRIFSLLLCCWGFAPGIAQSPNGLYRYDETIARLQESGAEDSFRYYVAQKCAVARQADSLEVWAWQQFDAYEAFEKSADSSLAMLDAILQQRWREPANAGEWLPFVYVLASKGWHFNETGKVWQAVQAYESALALFEHYRFADFDAVEMLYKPLGVCYTTLGDDDKALAVYQKALTLNIENESKSGLYCNIGIAYWNKGDYEAAEQQLQLGLALNQISALKRGLLTGALAQTRLDKGQAASAAATATQALALLGSHQELAETALEYRYYAQRTAGTALLQLNQFPAAEKMLQSASIAADKVFGTHSREAAKVAVAQSNLHLRAGRAREALSFADKALSAVLPAFQPDPSGVSMPAPDQFYEENAIFEALEAKAAAAQALFATDTQTRWLQVALDCHDLAWKAESALRRVFQYSSSKLHLQKGARGREEAAMHIARLLFEKTGENTWLERAFAIAERSKATLLLEYLQDNLIRQRLSDNDPRFVELNSLRQSLRYFDKNLLLDPANAKAPQWRIEADALRARIAPLERTLRAEYPALSSLEQSAADWLPKPGDFKPQEAFVEYFAAEKWLDIFCFSADNGPSWQRVAYTDSLRQLTRQFLAFFKDDFSILNDPGYYGQKAHQLCALLLPENIRSTAKSLTIVPDGLLNFLPFEALMTQPGDNLKQAAYLIRSHTVRYAWSLAVLRRQQNLHPQNGGYLLSVAPGFAQRERGLAPLSDAPLGWQGIDGWDNTTLRGPQANLSQFAANAGRYRVLHFSTHAFAGDNPRIELADSSLFLPDLYALPLHAELVVLSACQTGLGREEKGEGVMSLARAFAQAGAACVVSSLWSVNDQSTARMMRRFYAHIGSGLSAAEALQKAKLEYLSDPDIGAIAQSPYFWAGLVAVGDNRPVEQPFSLWWLAAVPVLLLLVAFFFWKRKKR